MLATRPIAARRLVCASGCGARPELIVTVTVGDGAAAWPDVRLPDAALPDVHARDSGAMASCAVTFSACRPVTMGINVSGTELG